MYRFHPPAGVARSAHRPVRSARTLRGVLRPLVAIALITWQLAAAGPALAMAGDLDLSFGPGGIVTTDFYMTTDFDASNDQANALVIQADGKLVAAGVASQPGRVIDFGLARYAQHGRLDKSFGTGGKVTTDFAGGSDVANALVVQADGKLVAAGTAKTSGTNSDFALVRYNSDGTLDPTFGTGGKVTTNFFSDDNATALALQTDGKLVAAGVARDSSSGVTNIALARYNTGGTLDPTFGTGGTVIGAAAYAEALVVQTDGKLVVAGFAVADFVLARYNPDGTPDTTFGVGGTVTTDFAGSSDLASALVVQTDGRLVAAGEAFLPVGSYDFALARYNTDGTLDTGFGTGGKVTTDFAGMSDAAFALVVHGDMLVAAGSATEPTDPGSLNDFALAKYNPNGTLDEGFGSGGKVTTDITGSGFYSRDRANALAVQDDGKLVAAGTAGENLRHGFSDFGLARYRAH
jgi:uncharacterized delta-60 repeat protein